MQLEPGAQSAEEKQPPGGRTQASIPPGPSILTALAARRPGRRSLREVSHDALDAALQSGLDPQVYRRRRHVVTENARVLEAREALLGGDLHRLGRLMAESHRSLRDDHQVSCRELDVLVDRALGAPGVHGARMTGAGFGGCTVNLVDAGEVSSFCATVAGGYLAATGKDPEILVCEVAGGAERVR